MAPRWPKTRPRRPKRAPRVNLGWILCGFLVDFGRMLVDFLVDFEWIFVGFWYGFIYLVASPNRPPCACALDLLRLENHTKNLQKSIQNASKILPKSSQKLPQIHPKFTLRALLGRLGHVLGHLGAKRPSRTKQD